MGAHPFPSFGKGWDPDQPPAGPANHNQQMSPFYGVRTT